MTYGHKSIPGGGEGRQREIKVEEEAKAKRAGGSAQCKCIRRLCVVVFNPGIAVALASTTRLATVCVGVTRRPVEVSPALNLVEIAGLFPAVSLAEPPKTVGC